MSISVSRSDLVAVRSKKLSSCQEVVKAKSWQSLFEVVNLNYNSTNSRVVYKHGRAPQDVAQLTESSSDG
ncbi:hypothetical protein T12_16053 [Trichinella patagoniensis]|nr:hypothetical protein T12_16053 [Trichinella patagoniensis]